MKRISNPIIISAASAALGLLCLLARLWLMHTGVDARQLLVPGHPGSILSWTLTAAMGVFLIAVLIVRPSGYSFRSNRLSGGAAAVQCLCLALTSVFAFQTIRMSLTVVAGVIAILAAVCCAAIALFRFQGKRAWLLLYLPGIVTLMLQFLLCFRLWGAEPEPQHYVFLLGAQTFSMLAAYHRAASECKMRAPRAYLLLSSAAVFFGFSAVADGGAGYLYGLWALSFLLENLSVRVPRRKSHEAA